MVMEKQDNVLQSISKIYINNINMILLLCQVHQIL